jgi:putative transposase
MPRRKRRIIGGYVYHIINRSAGRVKLFDADADYEAFLRYARDAHAHHPVPILAYCIMPNHWHFVVHPPPGEGEEVSEFFHDLTGTHAQALHAYRRTAGTGPIYQGRFKDFPVQSDRHFYALLRYVARNALRAGLVPRAESWPWGSLAVRLTAASPYKRLLADWPLPRPRNWVEIVNQPQSEAELEAIRRCVARSAPFGDDDWRRATSRAHRAVAHATR